MRPSPRLPEEIQVGLHPNFERGGTELPWPARPTIRTAMRPEGLIEMGALRTATVERDGTTSIILKEKP